MLGERYDVVLAGLRAGDDAAWRELHDDLAGPLLGYLRGRGAPDPEDQVGDTLLDVARNLGRFTGDEEGLRRWVFTIAHRRCVDALRRRGRRPSTPLPHEELVPLGEALGAGVDAIDRAVDRLADAGLLDGLLAHLTDEQREVLLLRFAADLDTATVAELTGRSPDAVAAMTLRALTRLRALADGRADRRADRPDGASSAPTGRR